MVRGCGGASEGAKVPGCDSTFEVRGYEGAPALKLGCVKDGESLCRRPTAVAPDRARRLGGSARLSVIRAGCAIAARSGRRNGIRDPRHNRASGSTHFEHARTFELTVALSDSGTFEPLSHSRTLAPSDAL